MTDTSINKEYLKKLRHQLLECQADINKAKRMLDKVDAALVKITNRRSAALEEIYGTLDPERQKLAVAVLHAIDDCYFPIIAALHGGEDGSVDG